jgi:hypothetical protein
MTKKFFVELELSLLRFQQNVEIPETHLIIHLVIQRTVEQVIDCFRFFSFTFIQIQVYKVQAAGTQPNISQIPAKLLNDSDSTFLNNLHGRVNAWIKSIQSVTKLML